MSKPPAKRLRDRGLWIAVFGPDGAGKSSVIEEVKIHIAATVSGITVFHFRPMLGSGRINQLAVTDPHARPPRGSLVSILKLIYWLLDCWCAHLFVVCPSLRRSELVIFDRYYPDILIDPLRYRLPASIRTLAMWLVALAPQPDLCVLLDAPAEVLQSRKAEVSLAESHRQRHAYLAMFQSITGSVIVNANLPINGAAQQVSAAVLARLTNTPRERRSSLLIANP
jgi:thymidylate kinase